MAGAGGKARVPYIMRSVPRGKRTLAFAEDLLNDRVVLKRLWPPYQLPGKPTWNEDPYRNRSWRLYYHGLHGVGHLLNAYELEGDLTYLLKARVLIESWLAAKGQDDRSERRTGFAWNEHSVASRALTMVQFLLLWRASPLADEELERRMLRAIQTHARCLAAEQTYQRNNHGIMQDRALLEVAVLFSDLPEAAAWFETAVSRLSERCRDDVSPSGVHLEHSPFYHIHFLSLFYRIRTFLVRHKVYEGQFDRVLTAMERYVAHTIREDGSLPLIGDTRRGDVRSVFKGQEIGEDLRYRLTSGAEGRRPADVDAVFADAGVAVFRDRWEGDRPVSLIFLAGFHSRVHKHADDLSVVLRVGETDFLIDSGSKNYDVFDPVTAYERSALAHNTITVDGASYRVDRDQAGRSGIDGFELGENEARVWGSHRLYEGVTVTRSVTYRKPDEIVIHDIVVSEDEHTYAQQFNFGEQMAVEATEAGVRLVDGAGGVEVLLTQYEPLDTVRFYRGQTEPHLGWASQRFGEAHPVDAVHFVRHGRTVAFETHLTIRR